MRPGSALLVVDVQNDFLPGGALPVPEGDQVVPIIRSLEDKFDLVVACQDWHPPDHGSFAANHPGMAVGDTVLLHGLPQTLWPVHCVAGTWGAELAEGIDRSRIQQIFRKGTDAKVDSYGAFYDNERLHSTGLADFLRSRNVQELYIAGLATDYCVRFSALDSLSEGFSTIVLADASRGIELHSGDIKRALAAIVQAGGRTGWAADILSS
ncbi:MAG: bifunctional nicotinamidase/pyrazinamidase [Verrucomicrobia bacterium]|nr:bifunctional nicotinamidase/pyrazinamidase [Verrucomicrobiota bacterium]